jgi:bifunctional N-acetylglucosamine-1-phosphate-uridyltransferase/glucosamine-1-phosphate-acetyltransferase GlmU-like protein
VARWAGIGLALRRPEDDELSSRLATYLHPLAGRSLVWHVVRALISSRPKPLQLLQVAGDPSIGRELDEARVELIVPARGIPWGAGTADRLHPAVERVLVVDAAAAALGASLRALLDGPSERALCAADGAPIAVWLDRKRFVAIARSAPDLKMLVEACEAGVPPGEDAFLVRSRESLSRANRLIRDRLVLELMRQGVTFLDPQSVWVDVDVRIGRDTVVYPGAVLEGGTRIGSESVIGPGVRIVDSQVGSGVELKGWNYLVNTRIRNRAVLEPYVRRGYD